MGDNSLSSMVKQDGSIASNSSCLNETKINATSFDTKFKIVSWNINGMRTLNMNEILKQLDAYVVMVQETKLTRKQLDQSQLIPPGYSSYFSFSNNRIGYSGVATFCKNEWTPSKAEEGLCFRNVGIADSVGCYPEINDDDEAHVKFANSDGRTVLSQHVVELPDGSQRPLTFINVYCPRLRDDPEDPANNNTDFKITFHKLLHSRAQLLVKSGSFVVLAGDINISHRWIDHCDGDPKTFVRHEFRKLLDDFLSDDTDGFVDSFRMLFPNQKSAFTCWNTRLNARENNYGTRIDYIFVDKQLASYIDNAEIHSDILGSDHCPISVTFHSLQPIASAVLPSFATKYYPEFKGKQTNLKEFMLTNSKLEITQTRTIDRDAQRPTMQQAKKRPLIHDSSTKDSCSKRVQTSLKSFFVRYSTQEEPSINTLQEIVSTVNETQVTPPNTVQNKSVSQHVLNSSEAWKKLMKAPEVPLCQGHKVPCVKRTVKKKGMNFGREFFSCSHGVGKSDDPNSNCNFFQWVKPTSTKTDKQNVKAE